MSWKGKHIFPNRRYFSMGFLAECKSGKTYLLGQILKKFLCKNAILHIICPTIKTNKTWIDIKKWLDEKGVVYDDSEDSVESLAELQDYIMNGREREDLEAALAEEEAEEEGGLMDAEDVDGVLMDRMLGRKQVKKKKKGRKKKIKLPEHFVVLDDCSSDVNKKEVLSFIKNRRHCRAKVFLLSQEVKDFKPGTISMCDVLCLFKYLPEERVLHARNCMGFARMSNDEMLGTYYTKTDKPYSYIMLCKEEGCIRNSLTRNIPDEEIKKLGYDRMVANEKEKIKRRKLRKKLMEEME